MKAALVKMALGMMALLIVVPLGMKAVDGFRDASDALRLGQIVDGGPAR